MGWHLFVYEKIFNTMQRLDSLWLPVLFHFKVRIGLQTFSWPLRQFGSMFNLRWSKLCNQINIKSIAREVRQMGGFKEILKLYEDYCLFHEYNITLHVCRPRLLWFFPDNVYLLCYHKSNILKRNILKRRSITKKNKLILIFLMF